ncbi:MAG TPA: hypothetical protein ENK16_03565 [Chromatiales bacterium]|nr:hypothetical protein [Chromatiales bacterium]
MKLWLSKPVYELMPYFYVIAGVAMLVVSLYQDQWYAIAVCIVLGVALVSTGLIVWLKRRDFRHQRRG